MDDAAWMALALGEAQQAADAGEVPVGAVLVKDGVLVATGRNAPVAQHDPSAHAEIVALRAAAIALHNYRLDGCTLYVTLEPCAMCAGAMLHARLARVVFGAADPRTGAAGSVVDLFAHVQLNHRTRVEGGVLADRCASVLQTFFAQRRQEARASAQPLRDDALRTPESRFDLLADYRFEPRYISDLETQNGWRMHHVDEGTSRGTGAVLALHGPGEWSYLFRHLAVAGPLRVLAPDLIGFGKSDKPKRESVHTLVWHRAVLLEWLDRIDPGPLVLVHSAAASPLAQALVHAAPARFLASLQSPDGGDRADDAWRAPFPDRGHEAALRALGSAHRAVAGPSREEAVLLREEAMGYFVP